MTPSMTSGLVTSAFLCFHDAMPRCSMTFSKKPKNTKCSMSSRCPTSYNSPVFKSRDTFTLLNTLSSTIERSMRSKCLWKERSLTPSSRGLTTSSTGLRSSPYISLRTFSDRRFTQSKKTVKYSSSRLVSNSELQTLSFTPTRSRTK